MIIEICRDQKSSILPISIEQSSNILCRLKSSIHDIYGISAAHYLNAGDEGITHFNFLQNAVISDLNHSLIEELNSVHACVLFKGQGKCKNVSTS